jgi:flagellar basal body-associated protein FliL
MNMGKFFLLIITIILGIVFAIVALLGLFRRFLLGFIPKSKQSIKKDESVIYDDGKTIVHSLRSNDRNKK